MVNHNSRTALRRWRRERRRGTHRAGIVHAPADSTDTHRLRGLLREGRASLDLTRRPLIVDLSNVRAMNSGLLATIVHLLRECRRAGTTLELRGVPQQFECWAEALGVQSILNQQLRAIDGPATAASTGETF